VIRDIKWSGWLLFAGNFNNLLHTVRCIEGNVEVQNYCKINTNNLGSINRARLNVCQWYFIEMHALSVWHSGGSRIFEQGVPDLLEQYQNNRRQSGLRDSFVHFLNFKLKWPQKRGVASHPIHPPGFAPVTFCISNSRSDVLMLRNISPLKLSSLKPIAEAFGLPIIPRNKKIRLFSFFFFEKGEIAIA